MRKTATPNPPPAQTAPAAPARWVIGCREHRGGRVKYYHAVNSRLGKAVTGSKRGAPTFDEDLGRTILRQLPSLDNRDWQLVQLAPRCKFS